MIGDAANDINSMKIPVTLLASFFLFGCATNGADIMDKEIYVSPDGVHRFTLDNDNFYQFTYPLDSDLKIYRGRRGHSDNLFNFDEEREYSFE